jgi:hypothetical protein
MQALKNPFDAVFILLVVVVVVGPKLAKNHLKTKRKNK